MRCVFVADARARVVSCVVSRGVRLVSGTARGRGGGLTKRNARADHGGDGANGARE